MNGKKENFGGNPGAGAGKTGGRETGVRGSKKPPGRLSRNDQQRIGSLLQRVYDDVVSEGVPDRFKVLLDKLEPDGSGQAGGHETPADGSASDQMSPVSASASSQNRESTE